ncbi:MAG: hypothetical protein AAF236_05275 [Verrucomicrobiota bacterium]
MKKLLIVLNDLEHSGKSVLARALSQHLTANEVNNLLVTSNEEDMTETFAGEFWDLEDDFGLSQVITALDNHDAVVVDAHSGAARNWAEFCEEKEIESLLGELEAEMTVVIPNTRSERCNEEITDLCELFADQADYVVAHLPGDERYEVKWKSSPAEKATRYLGAQIVEMPGIPEALSTALESAGTTLPEALNNSKKLSRFAEVEVDQWIERASEALASAEDFIMPEALGSVALDY